ncbi:MAG: TetR/AcrR family transcriptional regulator [Anaerolineae bacterium]
MAKVAKEAGVSAGIIYHYFDSKDALMTELYKTINRDFGQTLAAQMDHSQPIKQQICQTLAIMIRYYIQRPLESAFVEQFTRSPYFSHEIEAGVSRAYLPLVEAFEKARQDMIIKNLPAPVVMAFTFDVATSLAQKHAAGFVNLTNDLIEKVIDASWEAIRQ